jgi:hypothetical protein
VKVNLAAMQTALQSTKGRCRRNSVSWYRDRPRWS